MTSRSCWAIKGITSFVGYQAKGTPGHAIQTYGPKGGYVDLDGERIDIRAGITSIGGYSAHADQKGLVEFVTGMQEPTEIRVVHVEEGAKKVLICGGGTGATSYPSMLLIGGTVEKSEQDVSDDI